MIESTVKKIMKTADLVAWKSKNESEYGIVLSTDDVNICEQSNKYFIKVAWNDGKIGNVPTKLLRLVQQNE